MAVVLHERLICVQSFEANHNKFWYVTAHDDGRVLVEWGRVGKSSQSKEKNLGSEEQAIKHAKSLISKKLRGKNNSKSKYKIVDVVETTNGEKVEDAPQKGLAERAASEIAKGSHVIAQLVQRLVQANVHQITVSTRMTYNSTTGLFSTPLGIVGQSNITRANEVLTKMMPYMGEEPSKSSSLLLDEYLTLIPQDVGMRRPSIASLIPDQFAVQKQLDLLNSLQASLDMALKSDDGKKKDTSTPTKKIWDISLKKIPTSPEIENLYYKHVNRSHSCSHLKINRVFEFEHKPMSAAFRADIGNIRSLWHGSREGNILSIMAKGFIIPPSNASHCTGRMFGNGVYFSDQSTKALNYSYGYWSGSRNNNCFMFLCDVALGRTYTPQHWRESLPKPGYDSTFAKAGVSGVQNNEIITYQTNQIRPTHLVEFTN